MENVVKATRSKVCFFLLVLLLCLRITAAPLRRPVAPFLFGGNASIWRSLAVPSAMKRAKEMTRMGCFEDSGLYNREAPSADARCTSTSTPTEAPPRPRHVAPSDSFGVGNCSTKYKLQKKRAAYYPVPGMYSSCGV